MKVGARTISQWGGLPGPSHPTFPPSLQTHPLYSGEQLPTITSTSRFTAHPSSTPRLKTPLYVGGGQEYPPTNLPSWLPLAAASLYLVCLNVSVNLSGA